MPIWSLLRRKRSLLVAILFGMLATAGCQTDQGSRRTLSPSSWFGRKESKPADDEITLLPVPDGGYDSPAASPSNRNGSARYDGPPAAPAPESFYGVQRMGAEVPVEESWSGKFRRYFSRGNSDSRD